jgi:hypothetical protein
MDKFNAQIGENDKRQGVVLYVPAKGRNANVRVDWRSPQETLAVSNGQYTAYQPRKNTAYVGSARSSKGKVGGVFELLNLSGAELRSRFNWSCSATKLCGAASIQTTSRLCRRVPLPISTPKHGLTVVA